MSQNFYPNPHGPSCPWYDFAEKYGAPNVKWCEETLCQWVSEPANTWSNALYVIIAIYLFYRWRKHAFLPLRYAAHGVFLMGAFSLVYHLSNFYPTQTLDFLGMFLCIYNLLFMNIHRLFPLKKKHYFVAFSLTTFFSMAAMHVAYINHIPIQATVLVIVIAIIITEVVAFFKKLGASNYKNFALALFFLVLGASSSALDLKRVQCDPTNHWIQGHAMWHIFTAIMMYFIHKHYELLWNSKKMKQLQ
jgi:hypothetical protein